MAILKVRYSVLNGEVIAETRGGVRKQYYPDALGSTVLMTDSSQAITDTFDYWPGGQVKSRTGSTPTNLTFVGTQGYYSDTTSRYYVRARQYRADVWRWMTMDPIGFDGGDWNLYRYASSIPTSDVDPTGLRNAPTCCCCAIRPLTITVARRISQSCRGRGSHLIAGHVLNVNYTTDFSRKKPKFGDCTMQWFETTDKPYPPYSTLCKWNGGEIDLWKCTAAPDSEQKAAWKAHATTCFKTTTQGISDYPVLNATCPYKGAWHRSLHIRVRLTSAPGCCSTPYAEAQFDSYVSGVDGNVLVVTP